MRSKVWCRTQRLSLCWFVLQISRYRYRFLADSSGFGTDGAPTHKSVYKSITLPSVTAPTWWLSSSVSDLQKVEVCFHFWSVLIYKTIFCMHRHYLERIEQGLFCAYIGRMEHVLSVLIKGLPTSVNCSMFVCIVKCYLANELCRWYRARSSMSPWD